MRCLRYERNGVPWDVVAVVEAPSPEPRAGQVVVRLEAAPLHIADVMAIRGELPFIPPGAGVPGFEGVGRIQRCGEGVEGWAPGDRVILPLAYGACCEEVVADAAELWRAPDNVAAEQLALVRINLTTAYLLTHAYAQLKPGDVIVQNAANSNVGGYVAMLGRLNGWQVIDVVRRAEAVGDLSAMGRTAVLDGPRLRDAVSAAASNPPCLALDAIGGEATRRLARCVGDGGQVLCYGFLAHEPYSIDVADAMFRDVSLSGMTINSGLARLNAAAREAMDQDLRTLIFNEKLEAQIAGVYSFEEAAAALRHAAATGQNRAGKVILKPDV